MTTATPWTTAVLLRLWGYEGAAAYDVATALDLVRQAGADVALVDVALPRVEDGPGLAGRLRADVPLLVAVTGYADAEHRRRCERAGFDLVFAKPPDHQQLRVLPAGAARLVADARQAGGHAEGAAEQERQGWAELRARWRRRQGPAAAAGDDTDQGH
jgi:CheY-like chemotaxis protein